MHARLTSVAIQPDKIDEASRIYRDSIIPAVQQQKGNKAAYLLVDHATGKGVSITLWDSEADAQAYESSGSYREQVGKVAQFFTSPPSLATYTVTAHT